MTPRPPLGLIRPLASVIAPPGSPAPAARRRGASLSWRRAARMAASAPAHHDVHHHWPLTVNLLFRSTVTAPAAPPAQPLGVATATPGPVGKHRAVLIWERREAARNADLPALPARAGNAPQPSAAPAPRGNAMRPAEAISDPAPSFARTLHAVVEQRWLRTRLIFRTPAEHGAGAAPHAPADRAFPATLRARRPDILVEHRPAKRWAVPIFSQPMRPDDRPLFTADPLVHRALRRISVTPSTHRPADAAGTVPALRRTSPVRSAADIAPPRPRAARTRPVEQIWSDTRTATGASFTQPFAPIFPSTGMSAPAIAAARGPVAAPAAAAPDVNRLVDEVMRRIERQTRQDRLRRGM